MNEVEIGKNIVDDIIEHQDSNSENLTVQKIWDSMNEDQQALVQYLVGTALQEGS